jgi:hypothetical protein
MHNVSETRFYLGLQAEPTQLGPVDRTIPYIRTPASTQDEDIKTKHSINYLREFRQTLETLKKLHTYDTLHQSTFRIDVTSREINCLYGTNMRTTFFILNLHWTKL